MRQLTRIITVPVLFATAQAGSASSPYFPPPGYPGFAPPSPMASYRMAQPPYPQLAYYRPAYPWVQRQWPAPVSRRPEPRQPPTRSVSPGPAEAPKKQASVKPAKKTRAEASAQPGTGKLQFLERLQPLIERENQRLRDLRRELIAIFDVLEHGGGASQAQARRLNTLAKKYRVQGDPIVDPEARSELLEKIDEVPASLALAQAANESAWGQSRFAKEGNNLFGIWTYDEDKGIVPRKRAAGKKHLVRKFDSVADSVRYYLFTLNSHPAYANLRGIRADMRQRGQPLDGLIMADGLTKYSAKGEEYVRLIQEMIRRFDLATYESLSAGEA